MTAYNREKFIAEAINSVLGSSYTNFELIVVDDCSSDNTVSIARTFADKDSRIRVYVNEKNLGDYHNRNRAASYASGKYLKYVDSDDLIYPHGLSTMVDAMERFPDAGVGIVGRDPQKDEGLPILLSPAEAYRANFFIEGMFDTGPTGVIFNTAKFRQIGGFSGKRFIGDIEINLQMAAEWPVVKLPSSLVYWRKHDEQEFTAGISGTGYLELMLPLYELELGKPGCPLNDDQKRSVLRYYRKVSAHKILKILVQGRKPLLALKMYKKLSLNLSDLIGSVFFMTNAVETG
jgi:glycosyltransferase involved in cell wall biosynthesis